MAELIVALLKLCVRDPDWDTLYFLKHSLVDATFEIVFERVGVGTKSSNPEFAPNPRSYTSNGVVQSTIRVRVRFGMPCGVTNQGIILCSAVCRS